MLSGFSDYRSSFVKFTDIRQINCHSAVNTSLERYDITILRAPFDTGTVIHFDSHLETWDPKIIGGSLSKYAGYNHGTFLSCADSEGLILNNSVHAGIRGPVSNPVDDLAHDRDCDFQIITARDIDRIGTKGVINEIKERVRESKVYISVDIDVLDPAFAPSISFIFPLWNLSP